jgi:hypothetical protein
MRTGNYVFFYPDFLGSKRSHKRRENLFFKRSVTHWKLRLVGCLQIKYGYDSGQYENRGLGVMTSFAILLTGALYRCALIRYMKL